MTRNLYPEQGAQTRLALEDAYGALPGSPDWRRLNGIGLMLKPEVEIDAFAPKGALVPTLPIVNDSFTAMEYEGRIDFNSLQYPLCGVAGLVNPSDLGGSPNAYQWQWTWNGRASNMAASYASHYGFPDSAEQALGLIFNSMEVSGARPDGFEVSGDGFAKAMSAGNTMGGITLERQTITPTGTISGGSFTYTFRGFTATIPFDSTAAAIQTLLEALPVFSPGDVIVAGGPVNTTPVTIDYSGSYAGQDVELAVVDDALITGGGSLAIAETTPGDDTVTDISPVPAGAILGQACLDTTWAGLGTTQLGYALGMSATLGERMSRVMPMNRSFSTDERIDVPDQDHNLTLTLARNAVADAQLARLQAGTWVFPRVDWEGATISGANKYLFRLECAMFYDDIGQAQSTQNALTREYSGRMGIDPVSGNVWRITLVNDRASL